MRHILAFEEKAVYEKYQPIVQRLSKRLQDYQNILEKQYKLIELPKAVVWTSKELATSVFSNVPIPAYTNKDIIYISPDLSEWRNLFLEQLDGKDLPEIRAYYERFSENQLFTILAHELTHHSELFLEEFDEDESFEIWFEEGMCDYLARKHNLSVEEFTEVVSIESKLVEAFQEQYGDRSLSDFGSVSYSASLSSIFYNYWRSFLTVNDLVENHAKGNVYTIFEQYHQWFEDGKKAALTSVFGLSEEGSRVD